MKKMSKLLMSILMLVLVIFSVAFAATKKTPEFVLDRFKMKLGDTQAISGIINGDVSLEGFASSNEDAVKILPNGYLKANATGITTLTYTYELGSDIKTIKCYIEVTRYDSTFDSVGGGVKKETVYITLNVGDYEVKLESTSGAIPNYPEVKKDGFVFDGWYLEPTYVTKVKDNQRFGKDTTLYAKWVSQVEIDARVKVTSDFYDDIDNHWARIAIDSVTYKGLFTGVEDRKFGPEIEMTRAMTVAVLGRLDGVNVEGKKSGLADTNAAAYYDGYLAWAVENKIVTDVKDNKFRPNEPITREEIAIYIANYLGYKKYAVEEVLEYSYSDESEISSEARAAVKTLYNAAIMLGNGNGTFTPKASATRAQIAQIFYNLNNFIQKYK